MLQNWINIIAVFLSLTGGAYGVVLLSQLRTQYKQAWINSLFFYQILIYLFGIYGILGNALVRNVLLKFDVNLPGIESVARLIPFLGLPFMIAAWFLLIKCIAEVFNKKPGLIVTITYFVLFTLGFLVYGEILRRFSTDTVIDHSFVNSRIRSAFYLCELAVIIVIVFYAAINISELKKKPKLIFVLQFTGILIIWVTLKSIALHFSELNHFIKLYYLLLFFVGTLPLIFLVRNYVKIHAVRMTDNEQDKSVLYEKFHITPREREIIREICHGKTNKEIAEELFITLQTVKDHTHNIYKKVGVKNRVQLVQMFAQ